MKTFLAVLLTAVLAFAGGHAATISTMEIETDGDCDSAFVTTLEKAPGMYARCILDLWRVCLENGEDEDGHYGFLDEFED